MNNKPWVSAVIPTKNSDKFLDKCLKSIKSQSYKHIEVIIVDSGSTDKTLSLAKKYKTKLYFYYPKVLPGVSDAPYKRNYGVKKAKGKYIYYLDADMELSKNLINEAVRLCEGGFDAVVLKEDSVGTGIWARAKNLERQCYWGDDYIEASRFFNKNVWKKLGGLDEKLGGGGDDWDLHQKLLDNNYKIGRCNSMVKHHEGNLKLSDLISKRFMYGKDTLRYIKKRPKSGIISYFPIRKAYIKNWRLFISRPLDTFVFIIMRSVEYAAGLSGIVYSLIEK